MNLFLSETDSRGCSELTCLSTESLETARLSSSGLNLRTLMQKWRGWEKASSCGSAWETESSLLIKISPTSKYNLCLQLQSCRAETGQWTIWQKINCKSLRKQVFLHFHYILSHFLSSCLYLPQYIVVLTLEHTSHKHHHCTDNDDNLTILQSSEYFVVVATSTSWLNFQHWVLMRTYVAT